ncbi:ELMO domain-containing protein A [Bienertia sinuspersici]
MRMRSYVIPILRLFFVARTSFGINLVMTSSTTLRRRLHHRDVDGGKHEHYDSSDFGSLGEPLLGNDRYQEQYSLEELLDDPGRKVNLHWSFIFSQLLAQWAQWLANIVLGSRSLLGRLVSPSSTSHTPFLIPALTSLQEERLRKLQSRLKVPFDGSRSEHQDALKQFWRLAFPTRELPPLKSELWKEMGWQGTDPATDFRGGGFISLENLIYFAEKYPESFQCLLHKQDGQRAEWEYPFAVAGINISFMLAQMLDLQSGKPTSKAGVRFLELLAEDEMAFDNLYCVAFQMMDAQWLAKRASYMEFNDVLKSTRTQLERELELEDTCSVKDLPAYNLLRS